MSNATEQARSTRHDARAFAEAFAEADDAFTFAAPVGESRTMSLTELEAVLELDAPVDVAPVRAAPPPAAPAPAVQDETGLLTLAELGDVLAAPALAPATDVLDFDFGSRTEERARRRTAARADAPHVALAPEPARRTPAIMPLALPPQSRASRPAPLTRTPRATPLGATAGRRPLPGSGALHRVRADPDRIALYAVLLGILLVLIAASSSSASAVSLLTSQLL